MNVALDSSQIVGMKLSQQTADGKDECAILVTFRIPLTIAPQVVEGVPINDSTFQIEQLEAEIPETDKLATKHSRKPVHEGTILAVLKFITDCYPVEPMDIITGVELSPVVANRALFELRRTGKIIAYRVRNVEHNPGGTTVYAPTGVDLDPSKYAKKVMFGSCRPTAKAEVLAYLERIQRPASSMELEKYLIMGHKTIKRVVAQLIEEGKVKFATLDGKESSLYKADIVIASWDGIDRAVSNVRNWVSKNGPTLMHFHDCPRSKLFLRNNPFILDKDGKKYAFLPAKVLQDLVGREVRISDVLARMLELGIVLTFETGRIVRQKRIRFRNKQTCVSGCGILIEPASEAQQEKKNGTGTTK